MTNVHESRMNFSFDSSVTVTKFDETTFFNKHYKKLQESKGIDFILLEERVNRFIMIEVKNFRGYLQDSKTKDRLKLQSSKSVIVETALKVRDSIACIVGANRCQQETDLSPYQKAIDSKSKIKVILLLEVPTFSKKDYKFFTDDLKKKLAWLNVRVLVTNMEMLQEEFSWLRIENLPNSQ